MLRTARYGARINSYDILKCVALLTMVIDHVGVFLLPDVEMLRAIGRMAFPLFLFLVGYSRSYRITPGIIVGAVLLVITDLATFHALFALNILVSIILTRLLLAWLERRSLLEDNPMQIWIAALVWLLPTMVLAEYGSMALLFALCGYYAREGMRGQKYAVFFAITFLLHAALEQMSFAFSAPALLLMLIGLGWCALRLWRFALEPVFAGVPLAMHQLLCFFARNTLLLYVLHVMLLQVIGFYLYPEKFTAFTWIE